MEKNEQPHIPTHIISVMIEKALGKPCSYILGYIDNGVIFWTAVSSTGNIIKISGLEEG
jgi:hypothetical protein